MAMAHPARGDASAYERYLSSMDAAMKQKVAVTAAYLLCRGRVADMGMGSGAGSEALAALYPELDVVGVDLDPNMVDLAREKYRRANLSFVVGDIAKPVFEDGALDGVFDSSVLHHVTTFGGYRHDNARDALAVQARALKEHGVLVVRDFVDPGTRAFPSASIVLLDVPADDGDASDDPRTCSTAALLERFAREFRSLHGSPGFALEKADAAAHAPPCREGFRRYRLTHKLATEFLLRKDYRADWEAEVKEEYTYFDRDTFERVFADLGLRLLASTPIRNPWIIKNRLEGKCALWSADGASVDLPPTNYVIAGERVPDGEGVRFEESTERVASRGYLEMTHYRDTQTGRVRDLARKPNLLVDIVPTFAEAGERFVLARMSYPRPLLACAPHTDTAIDGGRPSPYVTEPLNARQGAKPIGQTVEEALFDAAGVASRSIREIWQGPLLYPSPGGVQEEVRTVFAEIDPVFTLERIANFSGFSTSGRVRALEARQVLRAAHVGGLPDARLETAVYALLAAKGIDPGPYIGESITIAEGTIDTTRVTSLAALSQRPRRRRFERVTESAGFLEVRASELRELDARGNVVATRTLEYVLPQRLSASTLAVAVLARVGDEVMMGIDDDDLPAAQAFDGSSALLVSPAWRLPKDVHTQRQALAFASERLRIEYGIEHGAVFTLGGAYYPAPGVTPEVVHPYAFEVKREVAGASALRWVPLRSIRTDLDAIRDGHLRVLALRAAHALSLLGG